MMMSDVKATKKKLTSVIEGEACLTHQELGVYPEKSQIQVVVIACVLKKKKITLLYLIGFL